MTNERVRPVVLLIPGIDGSGSDHWQTLWDATRRDCEHVELGRWSDPAPSEWMERLDDAVAEHPDRAIYFAAHSLGCLLVAWWAHYRRQTATRVHGALLVAPCNPINPRDRRLRKFAPVPGNALPFPTSVVASRDDPYATLIWSEGFANSIGANFVDIGAVGHINAESELGAWPAGQYLLNRLIVRGSSAEVAPRRAVG